MANNNNNGQAWTRPTTWGVLFCCLVALRLLLFPPVIFQQPFVATTGSMTTSDAPLQQQQHQVSPHHPLFIPQGEAVALPSIRVETQDVDRTIYGGDGDKKHLGGFTEIDLHGVSPASWKWMLQYLGIKSILDVGCGRGISTSWFALHGVETTCVEGSHDAVEKNIFAPMGGSTLVEHDFSRGPWWPSKTVDAVWCVEFLEHVGRNYQQNYITAFRKAALIFVTHSQWGGWHHVEVHTDEWWISKMQSYGFVYSKELTDNIRKMAHDEKQANLKSPTGENYNAQHVWLTMQVFINPTVASLPEHQHLFAEHGCYLGKNKPNKECGTGQGAEKESTLPKEYLPLAITEEQDKAWLDLIKKNIKVVKE